MSGKKKAVPKKGSPMAAKSPSGSRSPEASRVTFEPSENSPAFTNMLVPQGRIKCVTTFTVMPGMHHMLGQSTLVANRHGRLVRESDIDYCYVTIFRDDTLISNRKRLGVSANDMNFLEAITNLCPETATDEVNGQLFVKEEDSSSEESEYSEGDSSDDDALVVVATQPAGKAYAHRKKTKKRETLEDLYVPDLDKCQFCDEPIQICQWEIIKDELFKILKDGTLFKHWTGPLPFHAPTAKYYRWAAFEYWIKNTFSPLRPKKNTDIVPMCVRLGVCNEWYPQEWSDDDPCIVGDSVFARLNGNGEQRSAQQATSAAAAHASSTLGRIRRVVKFDCSTSTKKRKPKKK